MRYIVAIRKQGNPTCYYLSKSGFRCYHYGRVAVFNSESAAREELDYFARQMPEFRLTVERLPANVRSIGKAILSAIEI